MHLPLKAWSSSKPNVSSLLYSHDIYPLVHLIVLPPASFPQFSVISSHLISRTEEAGGNTRIKDQQNKHNNTITLYSIWLENLKNLQRIYNKHNVPIYFKPFSTLELLHPEDLTPKHKAILYIQFGAMKNALTCTSRKQSNCCISALKGKPLRADYRCSNGQWKRNARASIPARPYSYLPVIEHVILTSLHQQFKSNLPSPHGDESYWSRALWRTLEEKNCVQTFQPLYWVAWYPLTNG